ncbi:hypothetical protein ACGFW5_04925 [Streptomyces sp. NPDC048416]|uniref:hypothetical protein n=1 Tax=Streptomyces sp. NPDC048416 TaxID=3365546 RepID=UPI003721805B
MTTTPSAAITASASSSSWSTTLKLSAAGAAGVLLLVGVAKGCTALEGGPVLSEAQFLARVHQAQVSGEDTVRLLGSEPSSAILGKEIDNASCKDDLGVDKDGVSRDQPSISWAPAFADGDAGYRAALADLRTRWSERGWKVTTEPGRDPVTRSAAGLPGIHATDSHGITLSLRPGRRPGEGLVVADGGCMRHEGYWSTDDWTTS